MYGYFFMDSQDKLVKSQKKVSFSPDTKPWDGMRIETYVMEKICYLYCLGQLKNATQIINISYGNINVLTDIIRLCSDLISRLNIAKTQDKTYVPVLIQGGGRQTLMHVGKVDDLIILRNFINKIIIKLRQEKQQQQIQQQEQEQEHVSKHSHEEIQDVKRQKLE